MNPMQLEFYEFYKNSKEKASISKNNNYSTWPGVIEANTQVEEEKKSNVEEAILSPRGTLEDSNIFEDVEIVYKKHANAFSIDTSGRIAILGGKYLSYLDLDNPTKEEIPIKLSASQKSYEFSVVKFSTTKDGSPHRVAASLNTEMQVWKLDVNDIPHSKMLSKTSFHKRFIGDLEWSSKDPQVIASCAADGYIFLWNIESMKTPIQGLKSFPASTCRLKWNNRNPNLIVTSLDSQVRLWDLRKNGPVASYMAHVSTITEVDWDPTNENRFLTCSSDKHVKFWDMANLKTSETLNIGVPVLKAKYTPFGSGIVTLGQHADFSLTLWNLSDLTAPVRTYKNHADIFEWRIKDDLGYKEYQLVALSKDQSIRMWAVDKQDRTACGDIMPSPGRVKRKEKRQHDTEFFPSDMASEFAFIKKHGIPGVQIEELNQGSRTCLVTLESDSQSKASIKITFPQLYPRGAAPSFEFLPSTTLSIQLQATLRKFLYDTAIYQVERNKPCLEHCLGKLLLLMKKDHLKRLESTTMDYLKDMPSSSMTEKWLSELESSPSVKVSDNILAYTVKPTDTLTGIAITFNMKPEQVRQFNQLHYDLLIPGQVLFVKNPGASTPPLNQVRALRRNTAGNRNKQAKAEMKGIEDGISNIGFGKTDLSPRERSLSETKKPKSIFHNSRRTSPEDVVKEQVRFLSENFKVSGMLTITPDIFIFEPDLTDPKVQKDGSLPYQVDINMKDLFDCQIIKDNEKYLYDTCLEISVLKGTEVKMYSFLLEEKKLRFVHKKVLAWTSEMKQVDSNETEAEITPVLSSTPITNTISVFPDMEGVAPSRTSIKLMNNSNFLTESMVNELSLHLPARLRLYSWKLLYGTQTHGISLSTFYTRLKDEGPSILVVEDTKGNLFGAFVSDSWRIETHYYGSGESFLFKLKPTFQAYHWTQKNNFFMCSRRDFISIGGGSHFGLWLDSDFENGSSGSCETFDNPCLTVSEDFHIAIVEVWGFA